MPITTWITDSEKEEMTAVNDSELNELLKEANQLYSNRFLLYEKLVTTNSIFRKTKYERFYTLYIECGHEYQIMNFYGGLNSSSICTSVTAPVIAAYFYGLLAGLKSPLKGERE